MQILWDTMGFYYYRLESADAGAGKQRKLVTKETTVGNSMYAVMVRFF